MRYTALRLDERGHVRLLAFHLERLGAEARAPLLEALATASPGAYRATWDGTSLTVLPRRPSRLIEGMPTRRLVSPFAALRGRFQKPGPGSPYEAVRTEGVSTLLTDPTDTELFESDVAALVGWDGQAFVLPPEDRPGVASVAERAVREHLPTHRAPLLVRDRLPFLLINAVAGTCAVDVPGRAPFPADARARLDRVLSA